jgi:hypothetical protein
MRSQWQNGGGQMAIWSTPPTSLAHGAPARKREVDHLAPDKDGDAKEQLTGGKAAFQRSAVRGWRCLV